MIYHTHYLTNVGCAFSLQKEVAEFEEQRVSLTAKSQEVSSINCMWYIL